MITRTPLVLGLNLVQQQYLLNISSTGTSEYG
jgi:hypothetical protein